MRMRRGKSMALPALAGVLLVATAAGAAERERPPPGVATGAPRSAVTFNRDVAPLVFSQCASCHRPGEVAPFPLLSYEDVHKRARQIALVTGQRIMPPWKADSHGEFKNERRLSEEQINTIRQWVDEGAPEGSP